MCSLEPLTAAEHDPGMTTTFDPVPVTSQRKAGEYDFNIISLFLLTVLAEPLPVSGGLKLGRSHRRDN